MIGIEEKIREVNNITTWNQQISWWCKRHAPWINNCDWRNISKGSNVTNGNQQILNNR